MMDITGLKKQREFLIKKRDDISYERKQFLKEYNELKDEVKKAGIVSLVCLIFQIIIVSQFLDSKSATALAFGRYSSPFVLAVFIGALVVFLSKGFNLFVNADTELSKKAADKLERTRFADKLEDLNSTIIRLDIEIDKIEKELNDIGVNMEDLDLESEDLKTKPVSKVNGQKNVQKDVQIEKDEDEQNVLINKAKENKVKKQSEYKKTVVKKAIYEQKKDDNVDDLLSALDSWDLSDDEDDEFENSSELWKKDSKILRE